MPVLQKGWGMGGLPPLYLAVNYFYEFFPQHLKLVVLGLFG